ncbi:carboxylating nicotinate-nucleotide diphosphorylase [Zavarzinia compransoris]|uniref:carboxylating nicotinate-nucleotide diphosphorylase n=1 Tax=Zavarzinia marina TaxID=2911065 RepID=UPI001F2D2F4D|nr:carboxylating nicotinate-nucleotide diphosphorylase [Zavarzinia marina]MCF4164517.1 carboxylating nicotinate-nucleotide diphosphorylase [Zavarzinia marina]
MLDVSPPPFLVYESLLKAALAEDLGLAGDLTSEVTVPATARARTEVRFRHDGRVAGLPMAVETFRLVSPEIAVEVRLPDGSDAKAGDVVAVVEGPARAVLTGERVALNILQRLSGIATVTRGAAEAAARHGARVACTRKTTPGLRAIEKYAVRVGGGINHRFGLDDGILVKDNHIAAAGGLDAVLDRLKSGRVGHMVKVQVEVDSLDQLAVLMKRPVDAVLLDNMGPEVLRQAVAMVGGRMITEASGGIRPEMVADYAASGVDMLSLGWLTHSAPSLDIGLDFSFA